MFPTDAITQTIELIGIDDFTFNSSTSPKTILAVTMQQSGSQSETTLMCGSAEVAKNYNKDLTLVLMNYVCNDIVTVEKTAQGDDAFIIITTVPYDTSMATTLPFYANGFSYDGILIGFILFVTFVIMFFGGIWNRVDGIRIRKPSYNKYTGNNSPDGKIEHYD